ncbi:MAG: PRC-barrel domain-containing protein [Clostridia bacterium]|nr:PRC-barrel domain-containing protein [Clostridia bacterium]
MNKTTDFLTLPVLSIADARIIGRVESVLFDETGKTAIYLTLSPDDKLMLLPYGKILNKTDAIVIDSTLSLVDACDVDMTTLIALDGKEIYSQTGENKGRVEYVELFSGGKTSKICAENASYNSSAFQKLGDILLLKQTKRRTVRHSIPKDAVNRKVEIFDVKKQNTAPVPATNSETTIQPSTKKAVALEQGAPLFSQDALEKIVGKELVYDATDERTPARVISDYDFLLGRTLLRDLTTYAGVLLAKRGTLVTRELVETATRYGKLVDLTLNSSYR